jgi:tetratricopeptide (TPR) repeat protein
LRKVLKYFLIVLAACALVYLLFSCKGKKSAVVSKEADAALPSHKGDFSQVRFAHMYVDACAERMKGNLQEALKLFRECELLDPSSAAVKYELATIYKMLGDNGQAITNAKFSAEAEPHNEWYQLLLIESYNADRNYAQAIRVREALVKNFPARSDFKEDLAIDYAMSGMFEKSLKIYNELERAYGVNEQITLNKVRLLKEQKKNSEVEAELQKLLATGRSEPRFYSYLAEFYMEQGEQEKARALYEQILKIDPDNTTVHLALHDYYTSKGDNTEAFTHLKIAFMNPDLDIQTKAGIVGTFYSQAEKNSKEARAQGLELASIMLKLHPKAPASNALYADFLMLDKKLKEAAPYYYTAAVYEKRDFRIWDNLLFVDNELAQYDSLERHSSMAIELFPNQPRNYLYNGLANTQLKNYEKAARSLSEGMEFVVDNKPLMLDFLRLSGDAYYYVRNFPKSDRAFDEALKIDPDNGYVLNNYAYFLSQRNEALEKAEKLSKRSIELQPGNRNYIDTYGWILYRQKKYSEAREWLSKAAGIGSPNSTILEHYGDVLYRLNDVAGALKAWNAAKEAGGNGEKLLMKIKNKKLDD